MHRPGTHPLCASARPVLSVVPSRCIRCAVAAAAAATSRSHASVQGVGGDGAAAPPSTHPGGRRVVPEAVVRVWGRVPAGRCSGCGAF